MSELIMKEVFFGNYCKSCKYWKVPGELPCDECLEKPMNEYSHKPVKYEEAKKKK